MVETITFLGSVLAISCSGAMAPGPVTAAAITLGTRNKHAGTLFAVGHLIIELPLILLVSFGFEKIIASQSVLNVIGFVGGTFLLAMSYGMFRDIKKPMHEISKGYSSNPIIAGIVLSATNPYFLFWWVTIGIKLASQARQLGVIAFILFVIAHWLCDLIWFSILSFSSFKGAKLMSGSAFKWVLGICAVALLCFGTKFVYDSVSFWL